jgi:hypothetical protein
MGLEGVIMLNILPLCRKEKYFTSCILPQLICGDSMHRLNDFLLFLNIDKEFIHKNYSIDNLLFYTEYSLKESADWDELKKHSSKETPDLVILLKSNKGKSFFLIVIEAKMYSKVSTKKIRKQLDSQKAVIGIIKSKIGIKTENILHIVLLKEVPENLTELSNERILCWNDLIVIYTFLHNNYFYKILQYAITDQKAAKSIKYGVSKNNQRERNYIGRRSFNSIIQKCKIERDNIQVGFHKGEKGLKTLKQVDLEKRKYKWDYIKNPKGIKINSHWFTGDEFLRIISER